MDSVYGPLPTSVHIFRSADSIGGKPSIAYYLIADLNDKNLGFSTDTTSGRRLTPSAFYHKNANPIVVVNGTFFSFATSQNLNALIRDGRLLAYNIHAIPLKGKDSGKYAKVTRSAIGITKKGSADVAWLYTDSSTRYATAFQKRPVSWEDNSNTYTINDFITHYGSRVKRWKVVTAIGGGPVLVSDGRVFISNDEERMFAGKARHDRHPRTAMGYTFNNKLVILVVEGRHKDVAEGASLEYLSEILVELGCKEALNLDGGGSSCMLVNGQQTILPSDKEGQRPVPGVFIIQRKN
jgi:exopolysaccharide biosynthesis protein